jgi:uncharacterized protein (TIGR03435 family)
MLRRYIALAVFTCGLAGSQTADKSLTFDAASMKPGTPPTRDARGRMAAPISGGPGTTDPGRIHYSNMNLKFLLVTAYGVKAYQIAGPAWLDTERFDVTATMPPDTTREQFRAMLQNLLAERFKLTVHRESRELPIYSLAVGKNGPKLKDAVEEPAPKDGDPPAPPPVSAGSLRMGPDGFPIIPGRRLPPIVMGGGRARIAGYNQTTGDLSAQLTTLLGRPVIDETGLNGKYDFALAFSTEGLSGAASGPIVVGGADAPGASNGAASDPFPDIFSAIQAQLGLKLESKKGPVETIVVEHMERTPTEN